MLRFRRHIGAAYELLQSYLEARPNDEDAAQQLINVHMRRGHWDEAVERLDHAVDLNRDDPQPMNLGTGLEVSMRDLATCVAQAVGYRGGVEWDPSRPDGQPRRVWLVLF